MLCDFPLKRSLARQDQWEWVVWGGWGSAHRTVEIMLRHWRKRAIGGYHHLAPLSPAAYSDELQISWLGWWRWCLAISDVSAFFIGSDIQISLCISVFSATRKGGIHLRWKGTTGSVCTPIKPFPLNCKEINDSVTTNVFCKHGVQYSTVQMRTYIWNSCLLASQMGKRDDVAQLNELNLVLLDQI